MRVKVWIVVMMSMVVAEQELISDGDMRTTMMKIYLDETLVKVRVN